jgi:UDP-GlcNAc:undecaprenyl-phosphate GlcNAc-1-phosphate transferase
MELGGADYVVVFVATLAFTLVLTPLALRYAVRRQILDHPGATKLQASPVPYLGGAAIVTAFALAVLAGTLVRRPESGLGEIATILGLGVLLALLGLIDDLFGLSPWLRLCVEVGVGVVVWATPAGASLMGNDVIDCVVTVAWIVGVTNAFNLLDNMDGLSAGVAGIAAVFIFGLAAHNGQFLVAALAIGLVGCAAGFLRRNFHPASIYMGDAGSLFLGYLLSVLALKLRFPASPRSVAFAVPIVLLGVPLFDTTLVTLNRLRHGRNPFSGGRDHTSHRLVFIGIPVPVTVGILYLVAASFGVLAVVLSRIDRNTGMLLLAWIAAIGVAAGGLLSAVPVYESSTRRHLMLREVARSGEPPDAEGDDVA